MTLEERARQLRAIQERIPDVLHDAAKNATLRAVEKATELTPPTGDDLAGTNTRTGMMKARWAWDSTVEPMGFTSGKYVTVLRNGAEYASYVNDGHRMDRHFVPGLYVNPGSGLLEYNPNKKGGLVVGTKTTYVEGLHITDQAEKVYHQVVKQELKSVEELLK